MENCNRIKARSERLTDGKVYVRDLKENFENLYNVQEFLVYVSHLQIETFCEGVI